MLGNEKGNQEHPHPPAMENMITHDNCHSKDKDLVCGQEGPGEGNRQGIMKSRAHLLGFNPKGL